MHACTYTGSLSFQPVSVFWFQMPAFANKMKLSGIYVRWVRRKMSKEIWEDISVQQERENATRAVVLSSVNITTVSQTCRNYNELVECVFSTLHHLPSHFLSYFSSLIAVHLNVVIILRVKCNAFNLPVVFAIIKNLHDTEFIIYIDL